MMIARSTLKAIMPFVTTISRFVKTVPGQTQKYGEDLPKRFYTSVVDKTYIKIKMAEEAQADEDVSLIGVTTSVEEAKKMYDDWANTGNYEKNVREWGYDMPEKIAAAAAGQTLNATLEDCKVLDAGAGDGLSGVALKEAGFTNIIGTDLSPDMLAIAKERDVYSELKIADLSGQSEFEDNTFDVITIVGVLTYIEATSSCLSEMIRISKPGGILCFSHRTDKVDLWMPVQNDLEEQGKWEKIDNSEPMPYLPGHSELGDKFNVVIHIYRVL